MTHFPQSTMDATIWLICYHPERVPAWLERHPPGDKLYRAACRAIVVSGKRQDVIERLIKDPKSGL